MALRPLVRNVKCVAFVSEGAIKLLSYMLSRLEPVLDQVMSAESEEEEEEFLADSHWMVWKVANLLVVAASFFIMLYFSSADLLVANNSSNFYWLPRYPLPSSICSDS